MPENAYLIKSVYGVDKDAIEKHFAILIYLSYYLRSLHIARTKSLWAAT